MEQQSVTVGKGNERVGTSTTGTTELPVGFFADGESHTAVLSVPGEGVEQPQEQPTQLVPTVPPELQPDAEGNPPNITPELIRQLRGKYFTVKHVRLLDCNHLLDMVNQPKNNCETCWFNWFNSHAKLIEVADEFYRAHGKAPMVAMRGIKFVKNFLRFMSTVHHFMQLEKEQKNVADNQERGAESDVLSNPEAVGTDASPAAVAEGREVGSSSGSDQSDEQGS